MKIGKNGRCGKATAVFITIVFFTPCRRLPQGICKTTAAQKNVSVSAGRRDCTGPSIHADGYAVLPAVPHAELGAHLYALAQFLLCNQSLQAVNNIIRPFQMAGAADADIDRSHL